MTDDVLQDMMKEAHELGLYDIAPEQIEEYKKVLDKIRKQGTDNV